MDGRPILRLREITLFVEDVIRRQKCFAAKSVDSPFRQDDRGVEQRLRIGVVATHHRTDDDRDSPRRLGEFIEFGELIVDETVALQQIHRWIAGDCHFREYDTIRTGARRLLCGLLRQSTISRQVTDRGIDLGERNLHGIEHTPGARARSVWTDSSRLVGAHQGK